MKVAVIDIGTNTFNLLIGSLENDALKVDHIEKEFVFLGKGGINKNILQEDSIQRGLKCLQRYKEKAVSFNCDQIVPIATSAVRNADNGNDFVQKVKEITDLDIRIISGDKEAELIYEGAKVAFNFGNKTVLLMDIGGGSTEFIICNKDEIFWKKSFEVGAARLYEKFHKSEPISNQEVNDIESYLTEFLAEMIEVASNYDVHTLVGSSGAFTSFAKIVAYRNGEPQKLSFNPHYEILVRDFREVGHILLNSTLEERIAIPGLIKERAPMISVGTVLVNFVVSKLEIDSFHLARFSLKEGVAFRLLKGKEL